jgi:hypothetical protein
MRWEGHIACMEAMINTYNVLTGKPEGKSLGRPKCKGRR